jgi:RimJ/RimL family protein N-acetyltransferase
MTDELWPLFDLRVRTPHLELRPPGEADVYELTRLSSQGIHDPAVMPFLVPWTDRPSPERERESLQHFWRARSDWSPERWSLPFAVVDATTIVGVQAIDAEQFPQRRTVSTGSWVGRAHQGRGIGKEMRAAVLHLAFLGLGAVRAETGAWRDNAASLAVTRALGYEPNGDSLLLRRDEPSIELRFKMDRAGFDRIRRDDITVEGLEACLPMFGLDGGDEPSGDEPSGDEPGEEAGRAAPVSS